MSELADTTWPNRLERNRLPTMADFKGIESSRKMSGLDAKKPSPDLAYWCTQINENTGEIFTETEVRSLLDYKGISGLQDTKSFTSAIEALADCYSLVPESLTDHFGVDRDDLPKLGALLASKVSDMIKGGGLFSEVKYTNVVGNTLPTLPETVTTATSGDDVQSGDF